MAVYEYLCPKCDRQFELMRPMSEAEKSTKCPKCGAKAQKLMSSFGSKTGGSIQAAGKPFRNKAMVRVTSRKPKTAKARKGRTNR